MVTPRAPFAVVLALLAAGCVSGGGYGSYGHGHGYSAGYSRYEPPRHYDSRRHHHHRHRGHDDGCRGRPKKDVRWYQPWRSPC